MISHHGWLNKRLIEHATALLKKKNPNHSSEEVKDAVDEAVVRFYETFTSLDECNNPSGWLFTIAQNYLHDDDRLAKRLTPLPTDDDNDTSHSLQSDSRADDEVERSNAVELAYRYLPEQRAEATLLHLLERWKLAEIAEKQERTVDAVEHDVRRGRAKLQEVLGDEYELLFGKRKKRR